MTNAYRMSIDCIAETCPTIDDIAANSITQITELFAESSVLETTIINIFNDMVSAFKDNGTCKIRDALTSLCEDYISLEKEKNLLESELTTANDNASYWENQAEILQRELDAQHE